MAQHPPEIDLHRHFPRRAIIPLHPKVVDTNRASATGDELPDLDDVQGDVIYLFPKKAENFIFFRIADVPSFRTALSKFKPSTSRDVSNFIHRIADARRTAGSSGKSAYIANASQQIAFSRIGLNTLGVKDLTGDVRFDTHAMRDDKSMLGDGRDWDPVFEKKNPNPNGSIGDDAGALHGVITVAGSDANNCSTATADVKKLFGNSISIVGVIEGRGRPGEFSGHEHFGFQDGISQPALRGLIDPKPGQIQVNPGVLILGYEGDPVLDDPNSTFKRPTWAKGGTIMVFRKLEQSVPEFNAYLTKNGRKWRQFLPAKRPPTLQLTDEQGAELWGARMIGRWKSGAPVASCPYFDDPILAKDPSRNNNFDYRVPGHKEITDLYCPFTAHTRKTAPRDLDPFIQRQYLESGMIVRAGLPYGIEVTDAEKRSGVSSEKDSEKRGLLFVCYQSSLDDGFIRQTTAYAGNNFFPPTSLVPQYQGQDPILGGPPPVGEVQYVPGTTPPTTDLKTGDQVNLVLDVKNTKVSVTGFATVQPDAATDPPGFPQEFFVTSRGGEYFFVPPVSALQSWASGSTGSGTKLDLMFILDATSSMQTYIDEVCKRLEDILDGIVASGRFSLPEIHIGIIAFRDHAQKTRRGDLQDYEFVTKSFGFSSDIKVVKSTLEGLRASGGGDGPEAQCDALAEASKAGWRDDAVKIAVLVTDSPPHGLEEDDDKFPDGCPLQNNCLRAARAMANAGITLHVLACEPTLSTDYVTAHDFYKGVAKKTGGKMIALANSNELRDLIVGHVAESADIRLLAVQHKADITARVGRGESTSAITQALYDQLRSAGTKAHEFAVNSIYATTHQDDIEHNVDVWANAETIDAATKNKLKTVKGFRIKEEYRSGVAKPTDKKLTLQPVSLNQVDAIVTAALKMN